MCDEHVECYTVTWPKAVKDHKCEECGGEIPRFHVYEKRTFVWEGSGHTHKVCRFCVAVAAHWVSTNPDPWDRCTPLGNLYDQIRDYAWDFVPKDFLHDELTRRELALIYLMKHNVPCPELEHKTAGMIRKELLGEAA